MFAGLHALEKGQTGTREEEQILLLQTTRTTIFAAIMMQSSVVTWTTQTLANLLPHSTALT